MNETRPGDSLQVVAIVDDDDAIRPALARLIRTFGYSPRLFASAEGLLQVVDQLRPDCVLTDIQMPSMNGLDLVRELQRRSPGLPIMVMTAYPSLANRELALNDGATEYMTKPLDADWLETWLLQSLGPPRR